MTLWLGIADNELIVPDADDLALFTAVPETTNEQENFGMTNEVK